MFKTGHVLAGRNTLGFFEYPRKIKLVKESYRYRNLGNGKLRGAQQRTGFVDALAGQIVNRALSHVAHEHPVQMASAYPDSFGNVIDADVLGVVELDVLDGVEHILGTGISGAAFHFLRFLDQVGHKQVQIPHHHGFVLWFRAAVQIDAVQQFFQGLHVLAAVYGAGIGEGGLLHKLAGKRTVKPYPVVFPGVLLIRGIADQLIGFDEEQLPGLQRIVLLAYLVSPLAGHNQMDQVVIPDARSPGVTRSAGLQPAIEDGKLHIICIILFE